jgi:CBS domain-containing protein
MSDEKRHGIPVEIANGKPLTSVFHRLSSVLPESQELVTVAPDTTAADALRLMGKHGYSQLPIVHDAELIGVFSYRSFSRGVLKTDHRVNPTTLAVTEFSEQVPLARLTDEFQGVITSLDGQDAVLVVEQNKLLAIVTPIDILNYLHDVAGPYVLAAESELAIRALIGQCVSADQLILCAKNSLSQLYKDGDVPTTVEAMTVNDYAQIIGDGRNWPNFEPIFGGTRQSARSKLERLRDLRNDLYHFKKTMTSDDYNELLALREWLLLRVRLYQAKGAT